MILKDNTINIQGIRPELVLGLMIADSVYMNTGKELVVTSVNDGSHSNTSLHYSGCAADLRTRYFNNAELEFVIKQLKERLGQDFDVILEKDHIHLEYQPKRR